MLEVEDTVSHNWCPPSHRGHTWREPGREPGLEDLAIMGAAIDRPSLRVCKRCGKLGRVNKQGVICAVEAL